MELSLMCLHQDDWSYHCTGLHLTHGYNHCYSPLHHFDNNRIYFFVIAFIQRVCIVSRCSQILRQDSYIIVSCFTDCIPMTATVLHSCGGNADTYEMRDGWNCTRMYQVRVCIGLALLRMVGLDGT